MYQFHTHLDGVELHNLKAPWLKLNELKNVTDIYADTFDDFFHAVDAVDNFNEVASDEVSLSDHYLSGRFLQNSSSFLASSPVRKPSK